MVSPAPSAACIDVTELETSPREVAWKLIKKAELNADQIRAAALVVKPMQDAWDKMGAAADAVGRNERRLPKVGALVRLLIVGGGGCGKTRIINLVLTPLLQAF